MSIDHVNDLTMTLNEFRDVEKNSGPVGRLVGFFVRIFMERAGSGNGNRMEWTWKIYVRSAVGRKFLASSLLLLLTSHAAPISLVSFTAKMNSSGVGVGAIWYERNKRNGRCGKGTEAEKFSLYEKKSFAVELEACVCAFVTVLRIGSRCRKQMMFSIRLIRNRLGFCFVFKKERERERIWRRNV